MTKTEMINSIEVFSCLPADTTDRPPLLFVHGAFAGGWMWVDTFMPFLAEAGYPLSLIHICPGYHGFSFHAAPDVTLEEDLARRDLTINAMARAADGTLVDPFHGQRDISAKILRHVGPAFAEDPVRILRLARLAARFTDFSVAPETIELMRGMVAGGEEMCIRDSPRGA